MNHTPGPWTIEVLEELTLSGERRPASYISSSQGWANSGMAKKRTIAIVGHWKDRPNPEADARLIASAPWMRREIERVGDALFTNARGEYTGHEDDLHAVGQFVEGVCDTNNELRTQNAELLEALIHIREKVGRVYVTEPIENALERILDNVMTITDEAIAKATS